MSVAAAEWGLAAHPIATTFAVSSTRSGLVKLMRPSSSKADQAARSARLIEAARELGRDESPDAFETAVKKVARHRPVQEKSARDPKTSIPRSGSEMRGFFLPCSILAIVAHDPWR